MNVKGERAPYIVCFRTDPIVFIRQGFGCCCVKIDRVSKTLQCRKISIIVLFHISAILQ